MYPKRFNDGRKVTKHKNELINLSFSDNGETLDGKAKKRKQKGGNKREEERQRKAWIGTQRVSTARRSYIQQVNTNAQIAEAFWYGQQAAHAMEQSSNLG